MLNELAARHQAIAAAAGTGSDITVVFDAGQNSKDNFALLDDTELHFVGSIPPSDCPDLLARPATDREPVDPKRYPGLTAIDTRRTVFGQDRRVVLTHSPNLHEGQSRGLDQTLAKAAGPARPNWPTRWPAARPAVTAPPSRSEIAAIVNDTWVKRILTSTLTGDTPAEHRLTWTVDDTARAGLEDELFGKRILVTDHDDWPVADVVAGYRSQSDAEFGFRQLKDPHVVSFSPMHHWTDHNIRVHTQTCVFALMIAHLMRREADQAGLHLSVRELLDQLAGIQETVLIYPSTGGRPKVRRMLTETSRDQDRLIDIFDLKRLAPTHLGHTPGQPRNTGRPGKTQLKIALARKLPLATFRPGKTRNCPGTDHRSVNQETLSAVSSTTTDVCRELSSVVVNLSWMVWPGPPTRAAQTPPPRVRGSAAARKFYSRPSRSDPVLIVWRLVDDRRVTCASCSTATATRGPAAVWLFLHYAFDTWMARKYPTIRFERYVDDAVVH